jgi:transposase-like protein/ribosomal protein S27AE
MIRFFATLCKSLSEKLSDVALFKEATDVFRHYDEKCPRCGASGKLSPYGSYFRGLVSYKDGMIVESRVSPLRFECASCGATHALLPDILIPYSPYSLRFKLTVLTAYFEKDMTVAKICECFRIAASTLYSWKERLNEHKELLLGMLESRKESAIAFLRNMSGAACLSKCLCDFFHRHAFSFMQCWPQQRHGAAHSNLAPPLPFPPPHTSEMDCCLCP